MKRLSKFLGALGLVGGFVLRGAAGRPKRDPWLFRARMARRTTETSRALLALLGIEAETEGSPPGPGRLIVSNHRSYLDILALAAQGPVLFVTSLDLGRTALGDVCRAAGCLFVDRRRALVSRGELEELSQALYRGFSVVLFPEGTSSPGPDVLPFRRGLFKSALEAGHPVSAAAVSYADADGSPLSPASRDDVCWYGDMLFLPHLWRLCGRARTRARVSWLGDLPGYDDAGDLARASRDKICLRLSEKADPSCV